MALHTFHPWQPRGEGPWTHPRRASGPRPDLKGRRPGLDRLTVRPRRRTASCRASGRAPRGASTRGSRRGRAPDEAQQARDPPPGTHGEGPPSVESGEASRPRLNARWRYPTSASPRLRAPAPRAAATHDATSLRSLGWIARSLRCSVAELAFERDPVEGRSTRRVSMTVPGSRTPPRDGSSAGGGSLARAAGCRSEIRVGEPWEPSSVVGARAGSSPAGCPCGVERFSGRPMTGAAR